MFTLPNRTKKSPKECSVQVLHSFGGMSRGSGLPFVFKCRAEEWLRAEGIILKRRRQGGKPELVEDSVSPLPKPEPEEAVVPADGALMGGVEVPSTGSPPQPQSPTPLSYADEEPAAQHGERTHPTLQSTGQEEQQSTPSDFVILERPQKIPRRSGNFTFTVNGETRRSTTAVVRSIHQPPTEGCSGSNVKVEDSLVPKIKEEVGEVKVNGFKELKVCAGST